MYGNKKNFKIILLLAAIAVFAVAAASIHAQSQCRSEKGGYCVRLDPPPKVVVEKPGVVSRLLAQVPIPGLEFLTLPPNYQIGDIMAALYYFGLTLIALSALLWFVIGGVKYMLAGDKDPTKAKEMMKNAVWGLLLALTSWLIVYTINPDLVKTLQLNMPQITPPPQQAFVQKHAACAGEGEAAVCTMVEGQGSDDCTACGGQPSGCLNARGSSVYCKTATSCKLILASQQNTFCKDGVVGLCPSLCGTAPPPPSGPTPTPSAFKFVCVRDSSDLTGCQDIKFGRCFDIRCGDSYDTLSECNNACPVSAGKKCESREPTIQCTGN